MKQATDLQSRFYNSFDGSALLRFVHRLLNLSDEEKRGLDSFLGEGFHFQSFWELDLARPSRPVTLSLLAGVWSL